jgi:hypothetical protein
MALWLICYEKYITSWVIIIFLASKLNNLCKSYKVYATCVTATSCYLHNTYTFINHTRAVYILKFKVQNAFYNIYYSVAMVKHFIMNIVF